MINYSQLCLSNRQQLEYTLLPCIHSYFIERNYILHNLFDYKESINKDILYIRQIIRNDI